MESAVLHAPYQEDLSFEDILCNPRSSGRSALAAAVPSLLAQEALKRQRR